jgi:serine/threonine protein kinase
MPSPESTSPSPIYINKNFRTRFIESLRQKEKIPPLSTFELLEYIQNNKERWRASNDTPLKNTPYAAFISSNKKTTAEISLDAHSNIYISLRDMTLGVGENKIVKKRILYKNWSNVAFITPRLIATTKMLDDFKKEAKILNEIKELPSEKRRGLVETLFTSNREIVQIAYDNNLSTAIYGEKRHNSEELITPGIPFTYEERVDGVSQITDGLEQIHAMKIIHSDLKLDNILYRLVNLLNETTKKEFVIADFNLAFSPEELIENNQPRPQIGNLLYSAPEIGTWPGDTPEEQKDLAYRADVFSLALMSYELIHSKQHSSVARCSSQLNYLNYLDCRARILQSIRLSDSSNKNYNSQDHLYLRALHTDPKKRLSLQQFQTGVNWLKKKESDQYTTLSRDNILSQLAELNIQDVSENNAREALSQQPPGNYMLIPLLRKFLTFELILDTTKSDLYRAGLAYVDQDGVVVVKDLDVNPGDAIQVSNELNFLKSIGTITQPMDSSPLKKWKYM